MTESQSSSDIENSIRSLRIPALFISMSIRPHLSTASCIIAPAASKSATLHPLTIASPPMFTISFTTSCAGVRSAPCPDSSPPRSLTTTFAPSLASISACSRPIPLPAPVTIATRFSQDLFITDLHLVFLFADVTTH